MRVNIKVADIPHSTNTYELDVLPRIGECVTLIDYLDDSGESRYVPVVVNNVIHAISPLSHTATVYCTRM